LEASEHADIKLLGAKNYMLLGKLCPILPLVFVFSRSPLASCTIYSSATCVVQCEFSKMLLDSDKHVLCGKHLTRRLLKVLSDRLRLC
jgi:hypothetical protein